MADLSAHGTNHFGRSGIMGGPSVINATPALGEVVRVSQTVSASAGSTSVPLLIDEDFSGINWEEGAASTGWPSLDAAMGSPPTVNGGTKVWAQGTGTDINLRRYSTLTGVNYWAGIVGSGSGTTGGDTGYIRHTRAYITKAFADAQVPVLTDYGGRNINSGSIRVSFTTTREFWFSCEIMYPIGMRPTSGLDMGLATAAGNGAWQYTKDLYVQVGPGQVGEAILGFDGGTAFGNYVDVTGTGGGTRNLRTPPGWQTQQGGGGLSGSGVFNRYQIHYRADDGLTANGIAECWVNGVLHSRVTNIDWSGLNPLWTGWNYILLGHNSASVAFDSTEFRMRITRVKLATAGFIDY